ncbi:glycoside hydrolase family 3 N-terminal domain-containing protein [Phycicoccus sp. 3266]|uniref:glycoside hydrolase family 3 N-terminal domain-containing protein n=1 Tax=Phycicoccus sp. 3266 TaxID=2817751 RepID=UPI00285F075F|nr:glycoside hydrolase family 3 N-terminal domain-containing protein [Phycicoccus sp. 3266]MDR6864153.1 beta-glucosidase-like glycosyl hydrolase [Phycicoccus sp. 3266]
MSRTQFSAAAAVLVTAAVALPTGPAAGSAQAATTTPTAAQLALARMTRAQRIGEVLMVGTPATGVSSATARAISTYHVGSVILTGRSTAGVVATSAVTSRLQARATYAATSRVRLMVSTDQEGGYVQVLKGPGFTNLPTALHQGTWAPSSLQYSARRWGGQLKAAGVNLDLAPVADTVPSAAFAPHNPPIGAVYREFGYTPATVSSHSVAFTKGMRAAGVMVTAKHFPGLGRVTANTDTTRGVTDRTTTRTDPYLAPFRASTQAGARVLMVSNAIYTRIDPANPAVFSRTVISGMVRHDLGFTGVVVSDDLGNARAVTAWTPGARAVKFISAGGDLVLTVDPTQTEAMFKALAAKCSADPAFAAQLDAAALRVLTVKQEMGLL